MAFQDGCHPYHGISVGVVELGTDEVGVEVGNFSPSQYEPSIFALLVGQAGSSNQEVMEGGESCSVKCLRYVRAVGGQEFYGKHGFSGANSMSFQSSNPDPATWTAHGGRLAKALF